MNIVIQTLKKKFIEMQDYNSRIDINAIKDVVKVIISSKLGEFLIPSRKMVVWLYLMH